MSIVTTNTAHQQMTQFLSDRYRQQHGQCCIGSIDGDPRLEKLHQEWYDWPRQRRAVASRLAELAERGHNIYAARCLFSERDRSYSTALPSPWLWIDDVKPSDSHIELVETSEGNYQGWLKLDQDVTAHEARELQYRWKLAAGGDQCSSDATHMTRVPGGYNTKHHQQFPVRTVRYADRSVSPDDLDWPPLPAETVTLLDIPTIEVKRGDLAPLIDNHNMPRRFSPKMLGYRILTGEVKLKNKRGEYDQSTPRYALAKSCGFARYTPEDAATILWHYTDTDWLEKKGAMWHQEDIERCIHRAYDDARRQTLQNGKPWYLRELTPRERSYGTEQPKPDALPTITRKSRARRDRPSRITENHLITYWLKRCDGTETYRFYRRSDMASTLKTSLSTIDRLMKRLRERGTIITETLRDRSQSVVRFLTPVSESGTVNIPVKQPENDQIEVLSDNAVIPQPDEPETNVDDYRGTHSPDVPSLEELAVLTSDPETYPEMPTDIASAVREAFGVLASLPRITTRRIQQYLAENYPKQSREWSAKAFTFWIQTVRKERDWQKQIAGLRQYPAGKLKRLDKKLSRILTGGTAGPEAKLYTWACAMSGPVSAELERREPMEARANPVRSRAKHQACVEAVERDRQKHRPRPTEQAPVKVCATVERLRKRKTGQVAETEHVSRPTGPAQLPRLPRHWTWMFVPSEHMHRAYRPGTDLRTKFYHTNDLQQISKEIGRLEHRGGR